MNEKEIKNGCKGNSGTSLMGYSKDLFKKYDYTCVYCENYFGDSFENWMRLTREHVIPVSRLIGDDEKYKNYDANLRVACSTCNNLANRETYDEFKDLPIDERIKKTLKAKKEKINERRGVFEDFYKEYVKKNLDKD